jgi:hypothetical protein
MSFDSLHSLLPTFAFGRVRNSLSASNFFFGGTPIPVLFSKSAGAHENKGVGCGAMAQERKESTQRVRKLLKGNGMCFGQ